MSRYTRYEDKQFVSYIAVNNPTVRNRLGNKLYQQMVEKEDWAASRSWSAWREHYRQNRERFDRRIARYQDKHEIPQSHPPPVSVGPRRAFTPEEDEHLVKFLAEMAPLKTQGKSRTKFGRSGNYVYRVTLSDLDKYPWGETHTWHAWRERYVKNKEIFDKKIAQLQERNGIDPSVQSQTLLTAFGKYPSSTGVPDSVSVEDDGPEEEPEMVLGDHGVKRPLPEDDERFSGSTDVSIPSLKRQKHTHPESHDHLPTKNSNNRTEVLFHAGPSSHSVCGTPAQHKGRNNGDVVERSTVNDTEVEAGEKNGDEPPKGDVTQGIDNSTSSTKDVLDQVKPSPARPPLLDMSSPSVRDSGSCYPTLPTPLSDSYPLPGGYPEPQSLHIDIGKMPQNVSASSIRSHHPTPPPTSVHSDASVPSQSLEPDLQAPTNFAKNKQRAEPSASPLKTPVSPTDIHSRGIPSASDSHSTSKPSASKSFGQSASAHTAPHKPPLRSPTESPISDGPFATSSPSPRTKEVIRGVPKPRNKTFRSNDRVRTRNVVVRRGGSSPEDTHQRHESEEDEEQSGTSRPLGIGESITTGHGLSPQAKPSPSTYVPAVSEVPKPAALGIQSRLGAHRAVDPLTLQVPANTPISAAAKSTSSDRDFTGKHIFLRPTVGVDDVFASTTPIPSGSNHDPYVLGTSHLFPGSSIESTSSGIQLSTPVPVTHNQRGHNRRRTFPGRSPISGLPDVDLLAELKTKRMTSHSPALVWTRRSPDITILPKPKRLPFASSNLLSDTERAAARRGPSRKSVAPIVVGSENGSAVPLSLDQISPSASRIIFEEAFDAIVNRMVENHGFSAEVVRRLWQQQDMNLFATDAILLRMRIGAEMAANGDEDQDLAQLSMRNLAKANEHVQKLEEYSRVIDHHVAPTASRDTDYTPPARSRAGRYRHSLELGRPLEARQREIDLASRLSTNSSPSTVTTSQPADISIWGQEEDRALRTSSEDALRELARNFGEEVLRQKALALLMLDD